MDDFSIGLLGVFTINYGLIIYVDGPSPANIILFFLCLGGLLWGLKNRSSVAKSSQERNL